MSDESELYDSRKEVERLSAALAAANARADHAEKWRDQFDCCMCGSRMDTHDIGSGHSPVSMYDYELEQANKRAEAAEAKLAEVTAERDELDSLLNEGGSWEKQYADLEAKLAEVERERDELLRLTTVISGMKAEKRIAVLTEVMTKIADFPMPPTVSWQLARAALHPEERDGR